MAQPFGTMTHLDATHVLHLKHPRAVAMAEALAAFFARHPVKAP
jgi:hypothetical protein